MKIWLLPELFKRPHNNPFGTKDALLYRGKPCMCALRGRQPGLFYRPGCFASLRSKQGAAPLASSAILKEKSPHDFSYGDFSVL